MDHSQLNGSDGFGYDHAAWAQSMNTGQADPEFFFGGDSSVPVPQQGYSVPAQSSTTYGQPQAHLGGYGAGYQQQTGFDQYGHFPENTNIQHNPPLHNHLAGHTLLDGYPQSFDAGHSNSPAQAGYAQPRVASPYVQQPGVHHGMEGYNDARSPNNGYVQQNGAGQHLTAGFQPSQQAQFYTHPHGQQSVPLQLQQQQQKLQQQQPQPQPQPQPQQHRVSTPQQPSSQLLYTQGQQQLRPQLQQGQAQQQLQPLRTTGHQGHVIAQAYQPQSREQPQANVQHQPTFQQHSTLQHQQQPLQQQHHSLKQPLQQQHHSPQPSSLSSVPRHVPTSTANQTSHFAVFTPQQSQPRLTVPDSYLRPISATVNPTSTNSVKWTGMEHAFISDTPERPAEKVPKATLLPVFARTDRRRLFNAKPLLIPAEALGRYMDSLKSIASNDPQAGIKHRTRRIVLEYDLRRVGGLDQDTLDSYDKIPKSGPSKFQAEARRRGFEYPPLAAEDSIPELDALELRTEAILDLPSTWPPSSLLIQQVAADFAEFLAHTVNSLRAMPEYKDLINIVKAGKTKAGLSTEEAARSKKLRSVVDKGREKVRRVVATALRVADDRVLAALNPGRMLMPFQIVINLTNTGDINAPLTKALLDFACRLPFLDESIVEGFKWSKVLPKLEEGGDAHVKKAVSMIKDIVKSNEGKPPRLPKAANGEGTSKMVLPKSSTSGSSATKSKAATTVATSKRQREDEGEGRVTKKPAMELRPSTSQPTSQNQPSVSSQKSTTAPGPTKSNSTTILAALKAARPSTGVLPGKTRPATTKILSGSKSETVKPERNEPENKPVTSINSKHAVASKPEPSKSINNAIKLSSTDMSKMSSKIKKDEAKSEASRSASSGFAALMSEIEKPKAVKRPAPATPDKTEVPIDETDAERERRLRKEKRRRLNLRVSFKSEPELTAVRVFHKGESEDEERDNHMVRDANDDKAEGRLLKASRSSQIDSDREWEEPTLIDLTVIPDEQRQKTFTTRGGHIKVETEQQKVMAEKEKTELMVVYTDPSDIPTSAASPHPNAENDDLGPPGVVVAAEQNLHSRAALFMTCGAHAALDMLLRRNTAAATSTAAMLVNQVQAAQPYQNFADPQARQTKDQQVVQALSSAASRNYADPEPPHPQLSKIRRNYADPVVQAASKSIEDIVAELAGLPAPAQEPPKWQQDAARRQEWMTGYNNDKRAEEAARQAAQQSAMLLQQQQNPYAQYYNQYQASPSAVQQQQPAPADNVAATLAALSSATGQQPAQAPAAQVDPLQALMAAFGNPAAAGQQAPAVDPSQALQLAMWAAASGAQQHQPTQAQQYGAAAQAGYGQDNSGPRDDEHRNRDRGGRRGKEGNGSGGGDEDHLRGINRALIGTKPCTFWARGNCNRGDKCTFRHD